MSYRLEDAVYAARVLARALYLSPADFAVLKALAFHWNDDSGRCDPGHGTLADETLLSKGQIPKSLKALWRAGFIDWEGRLKPDSKQQRSNLYKIYHVVDPLDPTKATLKPVARRTKKRVGSEGVYSSGVDPLLHSRTPSTPENHTLYSSGADPLLPSSREQENNKESNKEGTQNRTVQSGEGQINFTSHVSDGEIQNRVDGDDSPAISEVDDDGEVRYSPAATGSTSRLTAEDDNGLAATIIDPRLKVRKKPAPGSPPTHPLAIKFLAHFGDSIEIGNEGPAWDLQARTLEEKYPLADLIAAHDWAWVEKSGFWEKQFLERWKKPFEYLAGSMKTIMQQYRSHLLLVAAETRRTNDKRGNHGKSRPADTTSGTPRPNPGVRHYRPR
jgi:hypothetical protein